MKESLLNTNGKTHQSKRNSNIVFFQPKLTINQPNDVYEQEADAMADRVMRMPINKNENHFFKPVSINSIQRKCAECEEEEKLQMKSEGGDVAGMTAPNIVHDVINSDGQPLDVGTRGFMESRFGYDFGNVQIHNDSLAHRSSAGINALAYTHGNHVVFGAGQYQPESYSGKQLLAHELVHVVQQKNNKNSLQRYTTDNCGPDELKNEIKPGDLFAKAMVANAILVVIDKETREKMYVRRLMLDYFNTQTPNYGTLLRVYSSILDLLLSGDYQYQCDFNTEKCKSVDAFVYNYWTDIHLCIEKLSGWSNEGIARAIIHEMAHYECDIDDKIYCNTGDGCVPCGAKLSEEKAYNNADSYACLAYQLWKHK